MLYVNRAKILAWHIRSQEYAQAVTVAANHFWHYAGKVSNVEVLMELDGKEYLVPIMTFERCFTCLG